MKYKRLKNFYRYRLWTISAKQCYLIGADCEKCKIMPDDLKNKCKMKDTIIGLTETLGKPFDRKNNILN